MKIFILKGQTGAFEDWRDWIVGAFFDEQKANQYKANCQKRANQVFHVFKGRGADISSFDFPRLTPVEVIEAFVRNGVFLSETEAFIIQGVYEFDSGVNFETYLTISLAVVTYSVEEINILDHSEKVEK